VVHPETFVSEIKRVKSLERRVGEACVVGKGAAWWLEVEVKGRKRVT
jgi:hypothetical protein